MPLRDHFRPPVTDLASWEELHGLWPGIIAVRLNALLPPDYRSGVKIHLGSAVEIDVATFELQSPAVPPTTTLPIQPSNGRLLRQRCYLTPTS